MVVRLLRIALALAIGLTGVVVTAPAARAIEAGATVKLAVAVPITVNPGSTGLLSAEELEAYTRPLGDLTRQLEAVSGRTVAIAVDPMIIVSIRLLGSSAPASATAWLSTLADADNETFALPYADSDITLALRAGSPEVLVPQPFDFAIDPSLFAPAAEQTPTPTVTPAPSPAPTDTPDAAPTLPTGDDLVNWPYSLEGLGWPRAATVAVADIPALTAAFDRIIISSGNVSGSGSPVVNLGGLTGLVSNDAISIALDAAVTAPTADEWDAALRGLDSSLSAVAASQSGGATVLATLHRGVPDQGTLIAQTLDRLAATPGVTLVPLSEIAALPPGAATVIDQPVDAERVATTQRTLSAESNERAFSTIVEVPDRLTAPRRLQVLALTSNSWLLNPEGWATASSLFLDQSTDLLTSVTVVESSNFNLLADNAGLPISVSNELGQPVTVYITVRPETGLLAVLESRVEVTIEANAQSKGLVAVQAISNGTVQALVTLSGASGVAVGLPTTARINVQAGWETPIAVVLASVVIAVFGLGIVRNIVRRRKMSTASAVKDGPSGD